MKNKVKLILTSLLFALCVIFSCGIIFANNIVSASGGIYVEDGANVNITGGIMQNNNTAIIIDGGEHVIENVTISGSTNGAVIIAAGANVSIKNCNIVNNTNPNNGGAIYVGEGATLTIENSKISGNISIGKGGAIYAAKNSNIFINGDTTIGQNTATLGGGIYLEDTALLNNGSIAVADYFAGNRSLQNADVWQHVYYENIDIDFTLEGIVNSNKSIENYENFDVENILAFDVEGYNDYYTWLPYEGATNDKILNIDGINDAEINKISQLEGYSNVSYYGENKLSYGMVNGVSAYSVKARRSAISGNIVLQPEYNNLPVVTFPTNAFKDISTITGDLDIPDSFTSIGQNAFYGCSGFNGELRLSENLTTIHHYAFQNCSGFTGNLVIPESVKTIGGAVFENCRGFSGDLILPNTLTSVANRAFVGCSGFDGNLVIGENLTTIALYTFFNCSRIKSVEIPDSVTSIGTYAFSGCSGLQGNLVIPESVTYIGSYAFYACTGLTSVEFESVMGWWASPSSGAASQTWLNLKYPERNDTYLNGSFKSYNWERTEVLEYTLLADNTYSVGMISEYKTVYGGPLIIPTTYKELPVSAIKAYAFQGGSNMVDTLTIPESITNIGVYAFDSCSGFEGDLSIPSSITIIEESAFQKCRGLNGTLTIPDSVTNIKYQAFYLCSGLTGNLEIPDSVTNIGQNAFRSCGFTGLTIHDSATSIETGLVFGQGAFRDCISLTGKLVIPNRVTEIGDDAFYNCYSFTGLTLGNGLTSIGNNAFNGCKGFTGKLILPDSIEYIKGYAFYDCSGFTGIVSIPENLMKIDKAAFVGCNKLTGIDFARVMGWWTSSSSTATSGKWMDVSNPATNTTLFKSTFNAYFWRRTEVLEFDLLEDNTYSVGMIDSFKNGGYNGPLVIPAKHNKLPITTIKDQAFNGGYAMVGTLKIPSNIKSIGNYAFTGCTGLTGRLDISSSVTSIGDHAFGYCSGFTDYLEIPSSITTISTAAFIGCTGISEVLLYAGLIDIENSAFEDCTSLVNAAVGERGESVFCYYTLETIGNRAFYNTALTSFTIPYSLESLGEDAFGGNTKNTLKELNINTCNNDALSAGQFKNFSALEKVNLSSEITYIPESFFENCVNLVTITTYNVGSDSEYYFRDVNTFGNRSFANTGASIVYADFLDANNQNTTSFVDCDNLTYFSTKNYIFTKAASVQEWSIVRNYSASLSGYISIPENFVGLNVTTIAQNGFMETRITSVIIPATITVISGSAFFNCARLQTVTFSDNSNLTSIGSYAFTGSKITEFTLPDTCTFVGDGVFMDCRYLETFTIGDNSELTIISHQMFYNCLLLQNIKIPAKVETIDETAFYNAGTSANNFSVTFADGINLKSIGTSAFAFSGLTEIELPTGTDDLKMENNAFSNCSKLKTVALGDSLTNISESAFSSCPALEQVIIGAKVSYIGANAFWDSFIKPEDFENNVPFEATGYITVKNGADIEVENSAFYLCRFKGFGDTEESASALIPKRFTTIHDRAFKQSGLTGVLQFENGNTTKFVENGTASEGVFSYCLNLTEVDLTYFNNAENTYRLPALFLYASSYVVEATLPEYLLTIGTKSLSYTKLTTIDLYNVEKIEEKAFRNVDTLTEIYLPNIKEIGDAAFSSCDSLTTVNFGASLEKIGKEAFVDCAALNKATFENYTGWWISTSKYVSSGTWLDLTKEAQNATYLKSTYSTYYWNRTEILEFTLLSDGTYEVGMKEEYKSSYKAPVIILDQYNGKYMMSYSSKYDGKFITQIAYRGFYNSNITDIKLLYTIIHINESAFYFASPDGFTIDIKDCLFLESIGGTAFANSGLTSIEFPDDCQNDQQVITMGNGAFANCSKLTNVDLGDYVENISERAFASCPALEHVIIGAKVSYIGANAFLQSFTTAGYITVKDGAGIEVGNSAFFDSFFKGFGDTKESASALIPKRFTTINDRAFKQSYLTGVLQFENGNTTKFVENGTASEGVFSYCLNLTGVDLTYFNNVENTYRLPALFLYASSNVAGVTLPNDLLTIGARSLSYLGCTGIWIPDTVTTIENNAFKKTPLTSITLPSGLTRIEQSILESTKISSVEIPSKVTYINPNAFKDCINLTTVNFKGTAIKTIQEYAFYNCVKLNNIKIPDSVTYIGYQAFYYCSALTNATLERTSWTIDGEYHYIDSSSYAATQLRKGATMEADKYFTFTKSDQSKYGRYFFDIGIGSDVTDLVDNSFTLILPESLSYNGGTSQVILSIGWIDDLSKYDTPIDGVIIPDAVKRIRFGAFEDNQGKSLNIKRNNGSILRIEEIEWYAEKSSIYGGTDNKVYDPEKFAYGTDGTIYNSNYMYTDESEL